MNYLPPVIISILLLTIIALAAKLYFVRRAAREIAEGFRDRLAADSNILIDISSRDGCMRALAGEINRQLRLLRRERRRYQQGDLELKEAVTSISHDLRTPLTAISGYLDLLECEETGEAAGRYIAQIRNRTEALRGLTEELFRYSVVTSPQALRPERMDLRRALEESLLSFHAAMQKAGIQPEINLPEQPLWRTLDSGAVSRVLANIIGNAIKYSGGDLGVSMDEDGCMRFSNAAPGLNAVSVGRLFDRFYTVEASRNSTGLGLSIARLLTERMGGSICAEYSGGRLEITLCFNE